MEARLRSKTDLTGLYLTGQDVLDSGIVSAAASGVLTAQVIHLLIKNVWRFAPMQLVCLTDNGTGTIKKCMRL